MKVAVLLVLASIAQAAYSQDHPLNRAAGAPCIAPRGNVSIIDLFETVGDLDDLIRTSPLILEGTALSVPPAFKTSPERCDSFFQTHLVIRVDEVIKGTVANGSPRIVLAQFGGKLGGVEMVANGDVLPLSGERYVFFLAPDERPVPNRSGLPLYYPIGGPAGKAKLNNGKIEFLKSAGIQLHQYNNAPVIAFTEWIKKETRHQPPANLPIQPPATERK